jgi:large subunit ribosomal protein L17
MPVNTSTKNLVTSVILYESVKTTKARAQHVQSCLEHILHMSKRRDLVVRRRLHKFLTHKNAVLKILDVIVPNLEKLDQKSGYLFVQRLGSRSGDGAEMVRIILDPRLTEPTEPGEKKSRMNKEAKPPKVRKSINSKKQRLKSKSL